MLLERDDQLRLLRDIAAGAPTTGGKVVLVRGEAGIGKSSLVRAVETAHAAHGPTYLGTCDDLRIPRALDPFWDIAREVPALLEPLDRTDRSGVLEAVLRLLTDPKGPTVLILEDTHWADEATLDAIRYVGRRIARTTGVLLLTYRDGDVDTEHPLRGVIGDIAAGDIVRIHLGGLSLAGVAAMVRPARLDPARVLSATQGNPLLVTEMITTTGSGATTSLADSVLARLQRLSVGSQDALRTLSIIPEPIPREVALRIAGVDAARLAECEARGLLDGGAGQVRFRHALIRETILASLTAGERHTRAKVLLRDLPEETHPCLIVVCAWEAQDADRLLRAVPVSARYGAAMGSHIQARDDWRALAPHLHRVDPTDLGPYLESWAREESIAGLVSEAIRCSTWAREHYRARGDRLGESRVLTHLVRYLEDDGRGREGERSASEAAQVLGPDADGPALARALEAMAYLRLMRGDVDAVEALVDRTLQAGGGAIDPLTRIRSLSHRGMAASIRNYPEGQDSLEEARAQAAAEGLWYEESRALLDQARAANENLDVAMAADRAQRAMATAGRHELLSIETAARVEYAKSLELRGDWDAAMDQLRERPAMTAIQRLAELPIEGSIDARRGRPTADAALAEMWQLAQVVHEFPRRAPAAIALAERAWISGRDDLPVEELRRILADGLAQGYRWSPGRICFWLWQLGHLTDPPPGIADPYRLVMQGEVGRAAVLLDEHGAPYERAMVLSRGDAAQRQESLDLLETLGATAVAGRVRRRLREQGMAVPRGRGRATRRHAAGLTARQAEVLELLREGLSDREIADRLFISPRTAEHHVAAVLDKLDAETRDEAVERARSEGLLVVPG